MLKITFLYFLLLASSVQAAQINEIRIDQPSADNDEYVELRGDANESLVGHTYLVIGDGTAGSGVIEAIVDLNASALNAQGLFTMAESTFTLATADLTTSFSFENSDNVTHLLVTGFTGASGNDLDTNDDGLLDVTPWTSIVDSIAIVESVGSGDQIYSLNTVGPNGSFVPVHVYRCDDEFRIGTFDPADSSSFDTPTAENNCDDLGGGETTARTIPEIQSNQVTSPFVGDTVQTIGVVTADFQENDQLSGFFIQDATGDADLSTSDGIFVFDPSGTDVEVGDIVEVIADVVEFFEYTQLGNVTSVTITGTGAITPTEIQLPEAVDGELERYEGMLVEVTSAMTITQNFFLSRYGQMTLSSADDNGVAGRLFQPTNIFPAASQQRLDLAADNARRLLFLDDGQDINGFGDNPDPVPYIGAPPATVIRSGDTVSNLIGVLDYGRINSSPTPARDYRLQPTQAPIFTAQNLRTAAPIATSGRLTVASYNVLNYFNTIDQNGSICGPMANQRCRGADTPSELARQQAKIVSALQAMDADVVGLIEIENNGFGVNSAIQVLTDALNVAIGGSSPTYSVLSVDQRMTSGVGGDVIAVGFIYKLASVIPVGNVATLETGAFNPDLGGSGGSRVPVAATFEELSSGEQFTAVINHFKSKRSPSSVQGNGNDDQGDGQASWNMRRVEAANDLADWLATNPTGITDSDILIIGDLNANAEEDPILALEAKGFSDMVQRFQMATGYSFTFDGLAGTLDHALASQALVSQISDVVIWYINSDEPSVIDYNQDFNPAGYFNPDPYRSSDHDPVIIGLNLGNNGQEGCYVIKVLSGKIVVFCM